MIRRLRSEALQIVDVTERERQDLYRLFEKCYDAISYNTFCADFEEKDHLLILRDRSDDSIRGFSTQQIERWVIEGQSIRTVFSGDTIVHPDYWGEQELVKGWCRYASWVRNQNPGEPLYWLLISKGYRTYLYLSLFCRRFYPHFERTEPTLNRFAAEVATRKFGTSYDRDRGVLKFKTSRGHLKPEFAEIPDPRKQNDHVSFFLARNPGYTTGEELVCLAELSDENVQSIAARYFKDPQPPRMFC